MQRGQATSEYVALLIGVGLLVAALAGAIARAAPPDLRALLPAGHHRQRPLTPDERALRRPAALALIRRALPRLVIERDRHGDDDTIPVDDACRGHGCAGFGHAVPVLYVHVAVWSGGTAVELWTYYPDSLTDHLPVPSLQGHHRDDWEGLIVAFDPAGRLVGARGSAHVGFNGSRPWWSEARDDWARYDGVAYRASGSHAVGLHRLDIDLAGDDWNGDLGVVPATAFRLIAADRAAIGARAFDPDATAPWAKSAWVDAGTARTGPPGEGPSHAAQAARAWAATRAAALAAWRALHHPPWSQAATSAEQAGATSSPIRSSSASSAAVKVAT